MQRDIEIKLKSWQEKPGRKPLIMEGARQVGKTYILKSFGEKNFSKVHYINFEKQANYKKIFEKDLNPRRILEDLKIFFDHDIAFEYGTELVIFDEIQECPNALSSLKYFYEEMPELHIAAAGSLLGIKLGESSYPVGKVETLQMFPMSFNEFLRNWKKDFLKLRVPISNRSDLSEETLWNLFKIYLVVGGLPEVVKTFLEHIDQNNMGGTGTGEGLKLAREKQYDLIKAYNADIAKHSGKVNSMHIESLWQSAALQLGREQNEKAQKFKIKEAVPGIKEYSRLESALHWLLKTGLLLKCHIIKQARLPLKAYAEENQFKLFVFDVGILGALVDLQPKTILEYEYGTYKGFFAENFAAQELVCSDGKNDRLFSWTGKSSEIEFVTDSDGDIVPIEIKSGNNTKSKSLDVFIGKYQPKSAFVLSGKAEYRQKGIKHFLPIYDLANLASESFRVENLL